MTDTWRAQATFEVDGATYTATLSEAENGDYWFSLAHSIDNPVWRCLFHERMYETSLEKVQKEFMAVVDKTRRYGIAALLDMAYRVGWLDGRWGGDEKWSVADASQ